MTRFGFLAAVGFALLGSSTCIAAPAGKAVGVKPEATAVAHGTRTLTVGSDIAMGDKIVTGSTGQVQLIFNDETHLVVGPSSSLLIESYLLRSDKSVGKFAITALGGSFRFITGASDHSAYTIATPTGTIGVRGTAFDFIVDPQKAIVPRHRPGTAVALFSGAVQLCDLAGKCVVLSHSCDLGGTSTGDAFTVGHGEATSAGARSRFRYIASERPLLPAFRVKQSRLCYLDNNTANSLVTSVPGGKSLPVVGRKPPAPP
jgi:hypothetical protein